MSCDLRVLLALLAGFGPAPRALEGTAWESPTDAIRGLLVTWWRGARVCTGGFPGDPPGSSLAAWLTWLVTWT
jgi:hypothetical protein